MTVERTVVRCQAVLVLYRWIRLPVLILCRSLAMKVRKRIPLIALVLYRAAMSARKWFRTVVQHHYLRQLVLYRAVMVLQRIRIVLVGSVLYRAVTVERKCRFRNVPRQG